jgi:hypothetical protein
MVMVPTLEVGVATTGLATAIGLAISVWRSRSPA